MRLAPLLVPAGLALAITGTAIAATPTTTHRLTVALPNGGTAIIDYHGDIAPQVRFGPTAAWSPAAFAPITGWVDQFAALDRQMDAMMRQTYALIALPLAKGLTQPSFAAFGSMPAGATSYSVVTTSSGGCTRTVETTTLGDGKPPSVVEKTSGNCSPEVSSGSAAPAPAGNEHVDRT